jgi:hypothetical protein
MMTSRTGSRKGWCSPNHYHRNSHAVARIPLIDISGVPVVDTGVVNHILQAASAARLLGTTVLLVGIGPEVAQTIVQLGIDLSSIVTRSTLQAGLEYGTAIVRGSARSGRNSPA